MAGESLGQLIRRRRRELGIPQYRLAKLIGVSGAYLSRIEHGIHPWPEKHIAKIAHTLMLPVASLAAAAGVIDEPEQSRTGVPSLDLAIVRGERLMADPELTVARDRILIQIGRQNGPPDLDEQTRRYYSIVKTLLGFVSLTSDLDDAEVLALFHNLEIPLTDDERQQLHRLG